MEAFASIAEDMSAEERTVRDPVCRMELDESHIKESIVHKGRKYYFCSVGCRAEFQRHPEDYVEGTQTEGEGESV